MHYAKSSLALDESRVRRNFFIITSAMNCPVRNMQSFWARQETAGKCSAYWTKRQAQPSFQGHRKRLGRLIVGKTGTSGPLTSALFHRAANALAFGARTGVWMT